MEQVKDLVTVDHSQGIMLCFCHSLFLFMIMNCIDIYMFRLCAGFEASKLDYGCNILIIVIMDHYGVIIRTIMILVIRKTHNLHITK
jgi:hypothetical protein